MKIAYISLTSTLVLLTSCAFLDRDYDNGTMVEAATAEIGLTATQQWQSTVITPAAPITAPWFTTFNDPKLNAYIEQALSHNRNLQSQAASLAAVIEAVGITASARKPSVDASLRQTYNKANDQEGVFSYNPSLNLSWELDLWKSLSDQKKSTLLSAEATQANFEAARLSLAGNIAKSWYAINADQLTLHISEKRLRNQESALAIVEEQYKSGRGAAMDIFLSRSDVTAQRASIVNARNQLEQSIRSFKRLLGDYPDIDLTFEAMLPELGESVPAGLPSDLLQRRPDIAASMKQWQASAVDIGIADKARFPSFRLTASYGATSEELLQMSASDFVFNLVNNLTIPIFQGGRLKSQLKQAELEAEANYQAYVDTLLTSFEEVESALGAEGYLKEQLSLLEQAETFAQSAYELAFEQYQAGLIRYSNLLDFEQRWFNTQTDIISVKNSRLLNRINLHLALGGDFK